MATCQHVWQQSDPRPQSPAKVFAMLKSKVISEAMCAREAPKRRPWMATELKENMQVAPFRREAQPLTLSPISSPHKSTGVSFCERSRCYSLQDSLPLMEAGQRQPRGERAFLESTAVSQPFFRLKQTQGRKELRHLGDLEVLALSNRTPVKAEPEEAHGRRVFTEELEDLFSPIKNRLRKRKQELQDLNRVTCSTNRGAKVMKPSAVGEDATADSPVRGSSGKSIVDKQCEVLMRKLPLMSTAEQYLEEGRRGHRVIQQRDYNTRGHPFKQGNHHCLQSATFTLPPDEVKTEDAAVEDQSMEFSSSCNVMSKMRGDASSSADRQQPHMTEPMWAEEGHVPNNSHVRVTGPEAEIFTHITKRGNKTELQHKLNDRREDHVVGGNFHQPTSSAPVTSRDVSEIEDGTFPDAPESDVQDMLWVPGGPVQPVLHEDPLVLSSPTVSIPKKQEAELKRQVWSNQAKFPNDSVVFLTNWSLQRKGSGLFIHGTNRESKEHWNTNIIADRVSNSVLTTITGRVYILVGKMRMDATSGFPKWLLKKFADGFPSNWKGLYKKFCSESEKTQHKGTAKKSNERGNPAKTKRDASFVLHPTRTSDSCPPAPFSGTKMSRSGRVIKPPLEYWKGARVRLDADMNVTIYGCYSSICNPDVTEIEPPQGPVPWPQPHTEGAEPSTAPSNKKKVPLQKLKPPACVLQREKVKTQRKDAVVEAVSSPEGLLGRTRSRTRAGSAPPQQSPPKKSLPQMPKEESHNPKKMSTTRRKRKNKEVPESSTGDAEPMQAWPSDNALTVRRKREARSEKKGKADCKSLPDFVSSEESLKQVRKKSGISNKVKEAQTQIRHKPNKRAMKSPPAMASSTPSGRKQNAKKAKAVPQQDPDEDEWTDGEIERLQEAASCFPKHLSRYWEKVAMLVGTRSAEECHNQHTSLATCQAATETAKKGRKKAGYPNASEVPVISARAGTLKRKQQVRQFLETMPREEVDDVFSSAFMKNKRLEMFSLCPSDANDITLSEMEPVTPRSSRMPEAKTPQCLHITPGMMGSPSRSTDDKYEYQLQRRLKKNQFDVCAASPSKRFTYTPSLKKAAKRCGSTERDHFFMKEMFLENYKEQSESQEAEEEEDYYFSDND